MAMHWIARCPACGATYRVVPDQIKIAQGWLRCGQCEEAFDSTGLLVGWPDTEQNTSVATDASLVAERVVIDELLKQEDRAPAGQPVSALASFEEALSTFSAKTPPPPAFSEPEPVVPEGGTALPDVGQQVKPRGWWAPGFALLLTVTLALQWVWAERQTLWLKAPLVATGVQQLCDAWGCASGPLEVREGVVIESSNWTAQDGGFVLSWTLRNATALSLRTPALELTLLDAQGQVALRRVVLASERNAPPVLAPGQTDQGQLLTLLHAPMPVTGYRLATFYPG